MAAVQPSAEQVAQAVQAYNERYGGMDEAIWRRSREVRAVLLANHSLEREDGLEDFVWRVRKWGNIQGVPTAMRPAIAKVLGSMTWHVSLFEEVTLLNADAQRLAVDRVSTFVREMAAGGVPRNEFSLASKVLHWLMPWRISVYDKIVRTTLGIHAIGDDAYRQIVHWQFSVAAALRTSGTDWLGTMEPRSPLRALDKYVWWVGGGKNSRAPVVRKL